MLQNLEQLTNAELDGLIQHEQKHLAHAIYAGCDETTLRYAAIMAQLWALRAEKLKRKANREVDEQVNKLLAASGLHLPIDRTKLAEYTAEEIYGMLKPAKKKGKRK